MLFSSIPFLYYFLPIVLLSYYLVPKSLKNGVLLAASLFFYGWGEIRYLFLMVALIIAAFFLAIFLESSKRRKKDGLTKVFLGFSLAVNIFTLGYFKYTDFFISSFNQVTGLSLPLLRLALPIGISFYVFQLMSYLVDVYRGEVRVQKNLLLLAAYVSMFPQLIAGPIVRYSTIEEQLGEREINLSGIAWGIRRFLLGLGKKVILANTLGECCEGFKETSEKTVLFFWVYAAAFMLHIYFDFSGYSDMAIGLGKMLGFSFPENFCYPYTAKSITEFWRRWHISLGTWFRDYVYIPLGGNRVGKARWIFNLLVVWFLTGFWHGAAWNFIVWGLYFAVFLVLEKLWLHSWLKRWKIFAHLYVILTVAVSFIIFDAATLQEAASNIKGLLGMGSDGAWSVESLYYLRSYGQILCIATVGATPLPAFWIKKIRNYRRGEQLLGIMEPLVLAMLLLAATAYLVDGSFNPFLYFRF